MASRLLILSCSARKKETAEALPAIKLYDGVAFRVLKRFERERGALPCELRILSAEHGLLAPDELVRTYDRVMSLQRANELRARVAEKLCAYFTEHRDCSEVYLNVGIIYLHALEPYKTWLPRGTLRQNSSGMIGQRLAQLRWWLIKRAGEDRGPTAGVNNLTTISDEPHTR